MGFSLLFFPLCSASVVQVKNATVCPEASGERCSDPVPTPGCGWLRAKLFLVYCLGMVCVEIK